MNDEKQAFAKNSNYMTSNPPNGSLFYRISESIRNIADTRPHGKYTVQDIDNIIASASADTNAVQPGDISASIEHDEDGDIPMFDLNDETDIQLISNYLSNQRGLEENSTVHSKQQIDDRIPLLNPTTLKTVFVVDTNFIISHLNTLENLRSLSNTYHHLIVVPSTVIQELDGLKKNSDVVREGNTNKEQGRTIGALARWGNDWIYKNLANLDSGLIGQKLKQRLNADCIKDDSILDCCLYFKEVLNCFVILLSNDKNLCTKALTEDILTVSFRRGMDANLIASKAYEENQLRFGNPPTPMVSTHHHDSASYSDTPGMETTRLSQGELLQSIFEQVKSTVFFAIDQALRKEYGEDIEFIDYDPGKLNTLASASHYIYTFWVSVFSGFFIHSKIKKDDWKKLPTILLSKPTSLDELKTFKQFWEDVLHFLFTSFSNEQKQVLEEQVNSWTKCIKSASA
ncbi:YOR166C [Saccharomyces arboricola H-6]|uniref:Transcriptional protein SWT1 n=1 Tax=Saccharomyces arboricola (strain H-6 / AS 2.3317 / CBS 10644) TaxID=1160507 RepID=J8PWC8_SACAR|nr:YOR166C [Saccharomyces arboricola H-6]